MLKRPVQISTFVIGDVLQCIHREFIMTNSRKMEFFVNKGVYVLELEGDKYYVGKSNNILERIVQHKANGKKIAKRMQTKTPPSTDWESWERNETLHWMREKGIQNVRGWMFTTGVLSKEQLKQAFAQICEKYDLCRRCGSGGHFVKHCHVEMCNNDHILQSGGGLTHNSSDKMMVDDVLQCGV